MGLLFNLWIFLLMMEATVSTILTLNAFHPCPAVHINMFIKFPGAVYIALLIIPRSRGEEKTSTVMLIETTQNQPH